MKIATWNVNSIRARVIHFNKWVQESDPDIILLQELKCTQDTFPYDLIENQSYNIAVHGEKSYNGVAILSKYPLEDIVTTFDQVPHPHHARYIECFTGGVRVASIYVPNGQEVGSEKYAYKLEFYKALQAHLKTLIQPWEKLVIGGDFNVAPYATDMHNPTYAGTDRILCSTPEQEALRACFAEGLHDAMADHDQAFTWWDYRRGSFDHNKGYRIDFMLLSSLAYNDLKTAYVELNPRSWTRPSDHAPVCVILS